MTPSAALEALDMLEPLFFFYLFELLNVRAAICKVSRSVAHGMRELSLLKLLHLSLSLHFALCHLLLEAKATLVTIVSLSFQHVLKGDFRVVTPL